MSKSSTQTTNKVKCPVSGCKHRLALQAHPAQSGRVVAVCNCGGPRQGLPVYETNSSEPEVIDTIEAIAATETEKQEV